MGDDNHKQQPLDRLEVARISIATNLHKTRSVEQLIKMSKFSLKKPTINFDPIANYRGTLEMLHVLAEELALLRGRIDGRPVRSLDELAQLRPADPKGEQQ